ncbi:MAG: NADPH-dependent FMN reductase [Bradymonadia bacterium]
MRILAFAATIHTGSINKQLVTYAARLLEEGLVEGAEVEIIDLADYELPLFTQDREVQLGQPPLAQKFLDQIAAADALLISFAEHNGNMTVAWKNLFDWCSRIEGKVYQGTPAVFLSTSPGGRGGVGAVQAAMARAPFAGGDVKATFALPSFGKNFDKEAGEITDPELRQGLIEALKALG